MPLRPLAVLILACTVALRDGAKGWGRSEMAAEIVTLLQDMGARVVPTPVVSWHPAP